MPSRRRRSRGVVGGGAVAGDVEALPSVGQVGGLTDAALEAALEQVGQDAALLGDRAGKEAALEAILADREAAVQVASEILGLEDGEDADGEPVLPAPEALRYFAAARAVEDAIGALEAAQGGGRDDALAALAMAGVPPDEAEDLPDWAVFRALEVAIEAAAHSRSSTSTARRSPRRSRTPTRLGQRKTAKSPSSSGKGRPGSLARPDAGARAAAAVPGAEMSRAAKRALAGAPFEAVVAVCACVGVVFFALFGVIFEALRLHPTGADDDAASSSFSTVLVMAAAGLAVGITVARSFTG